MGGLNFKLMQGIEETEGLLKQEKQPQESSVPNEVEKRPSEEPSGEIGEALEPSPKSKATPKKEKQKKEKEKGREEKQVFSFRAPLSEIALWKAFAMATGETMENIGCMAMSEYIKRYKLSGAELAVFEAIKAREGNS